MNDNDEMLRAAQQVAKAISDPGVNPAYHRQQVNNLSINWPTMYRAVNNLVTVLARRKSPEGATSAPHGQGVEYKKGSDSTVRTDTEPLSLNERGLFTADLVGGIHVNMDGIPGPLAFQPTSNVVGFDFRHPVTISQRPTGPEPPPRQRAITAEAVHRVRRERDAARAEVERLVAERDAARAEVRRLTSKLDAARAGVDKVEAERILCNLAGPQASGRACECGEHRFRLRSATSNDALIDAFNRILDELPPDAR